MRDSGRPEPPTVVVLLAPGGAHDAHALRQVLAGLEEEGVPAAVETAAAHDCVALAERAAERSSLEVGVGIAADGVCLTHRALHGRPPLEHLLDPVVASRARCLGHDAARLVTGIALKLPAG
ncbi:glycerol dehydratase reactivase beta/small subunit family protein [Nocardioides aquaticus]|uniref:glycerol dehydratase reactivase beta/small subunit family protein n=1 Tax=Nocardioides aquaticus TaxID=160826 RepID=UPI001BD50889|nr:glycerol dehydratase reactivase beta/small subunit family protein [Nocardioides aquaticus]